jgi:hypothetical protein
MVLELSGTLSKNDFPYVIFHFSFVIEIERRALILRRFPNRERDQSFDDK